ncbi:L-threo-3-deoxy-hexylosonate aldolase [Sphaceloma murrayae]|uniref:L-threo-3-deoxy-hexylosonate aldolase n=1 Tax=Sphaceloma murrayae TaxID=2082308 RepID=A0A2K1QPL7_9PEZI|nr:L-threo-3-deoxy-hexylosonate aldolase [Sphaceloma murrayae]
MSPAALSSSQVKPYPPGIHVPTLTWFKDDEDQNLDWEVQETHLRFLITSGLHGIVIAGTNGEAAALSQKERLDLIRLTRQVAEASGKPDLPITVGCNGGCTRAVIEETIAAADAGADYALVLVPSYFHFAMTSDAITAFFLEVADKSPIPIVVYNFPGVVSGLDVNSEMLDVLGQHPNIVAVKLTCGGIAKVARAAAKFGAFNGKTGGESFRALAGQSDWLVPALIIGGAGCITGLANLYPKACLEMYERWKSGRLAGAVEIQNELAKSEIGFGQGGINGTKWIVAKLRGYPEGSSHCRRPYPRFSDDKKKSWLAGKMEICMPLEASLADSK